MILLDLFARASSVTAHGSVPACLLACLLACLAMPCACALIACLLVEPRTATVRAPLCLCRAVWAVSARLVFLAFESLPAEVVVADSGFCKRCNELGSCCCLPRRCFCSLLACLLACLLESHPLALAYLLAAFASVCPCRLGHSCRRCCLPRHCCLSRQCSCPLKFMLHC